MNWRYPRSEYSDGLVNPCAPPRVLSSRREVNVTKKCLSSETRITMLNKYCQLLYFSIFRYTFIEEELIPYQATPCFHHDSILERINVSFCVPVLLFIVAYL